MKKLLLIALCICVVGSLAYGQTSNVLSRNAVGYTKVTAARGTNALVRYDFNPLVGSSTASNLFGLSTFPLGTALYIWDNVNLAYRNETLISNKANNVHWSPNTNAIVPGIGFWIKVPSTAASNEYSAFLMGEVPDRFTAPTSTVNIVPGANLIGYPYPAEVTWTSTVLAKSAVLGDSLYVWNGAAYQNNTLVSNKAEGIHWANATQVLRTAEGYWFKRVATASPVTWKEPKPYTWP